ncbi:hypothetical protein K431DRAFT_309734 [Polychaeton citri CBS 116435]|uniref:F-box domain-containing protein n=1 Tax=Polychaeton citri CBS 116435 TaxID=1314669 RepID=A0A9P4QHP0_9PEZI|nr:hypothetical protein K431DRAFT_309734 [Polychaeton citri CBS 116435]
MDEALQRAEILKLFDRVASREHRLAIVRLLSDRLAYPERLELRDHVNGKIDLLSSLPLELTAHVFGYLSLFEAWRLRLVCRRWNQVLSSTCVQSAALARWQTHGPEALPLPLATWSTPARIRHIQAIRLGRPFYTTTWEHIVSTPVFKLRHEKIALCGAHTAYIRNNVRSEAKEVVLRDLAGASMNILRGDAKEQILHLHLTDTHISFIGFVGTLYIISLTDLQARCSHRLPRAGIDTMSAHGPRVALGWMETDHEQTDEESYRSFTIAVFDTAGCLASTTLPPLPHVASKLKCDSLRSYQLRALHLEACTLDVFGLNQDHVVHHRLYLDEHGTITGQAARRYLLTSLDAFMSASQLRLHKLLPIGQQGVFLAGYSFHNNWGADVTGGLLFFDSGRDELFVKTFAVPENFALSRGDPTFAIWKDTVFAHHPFKEIVTYRLHDRSSRSVRLPHDGNSPSCQQVMTLVESDLEMVSSTQTPYSYNLTSDTCSFLVNDTFLVHTSYRRANGSIMVRSFDERVRPPGANITGCWDQRAEKSYLETHSFARPLKLPYTEGMEEIIHSAEDRRRRQREDIATDAFGRRASYMID